MARALDISAPGVPATTVRIAIIMDDLGYNRSSGERALQLPGPVTFAIIPFTPHSRTLAQHAHDLEREILLHMPMASHHPGRRLDEGGLTLAHSEAEVRARVAAAIRAVPHAIGMNNHMGSQITTDQQVMHWVMDEVRQTPLFFIDSVTNGHSIARQTALRHRIPSIRRDVFLDNHPEFNAIDAAFNQLILIARRKGHAVAIGHPHGATLSYLEHKLPQLAAMGIELVPVSTLARQFGMPADKPLRLQELLRWIIAMPTPASDRLNFSR